MLKCRTFAAPLGDEVNSVGGGTVMPGCHLLDIVEESVSKELALRRSSIWNASGEVDVVPDGQGVGAQGALYDPINRQLFPATLAAHLLQQIVDLAHCEVDLRAETGDADTLGGKNERVGEQISHQEQYVVDSNLHRQLVGRKVPGLLIHVHDRLGSIVFNGQRTSLGDIGLV